MCVSLYSGEWKETGWVLSIFVVYLRLCTEFSISELTNLPGTWTGSKMVSARSGTSVVLSFFTALWKRSDLRLLAASCEGCRRTLLLSCRIRRNTAGCMHRVRRLTRLLGWIYEFGALYKVAYAESGYLAETGR
ncbi:unnamed protein product [Ectocarpus sp. 8 AP-2014]